MVVIQKQFCYIQLSKAESLHFNHILTASFQIRVKLSEEANNKNGVTAQILIALT